MKQTALRFSSRHLEMIEEIRNELGYKTLSSVIEHCIIETYQSVFNSVKINRDKFKLKNTRELMTPIEKANEQIGIELAKEEAKKEKAKQVEKALIERGRGYCRLLKGKEKNGECHFNSYLYAGVNNCRIQKEEKAFEHITEDDIQHQHYDWNDNKIVPIQVIKDALDICGTPYPKNIK